MTVSQTDTSGMSSPVSGTTKNRKALFFQLGTMPEFAEFRSGEVCQVNPVRTRRILHGGPPAGKLPAGGMERCLCIHAHLPPDIDQREQHIAQLKLNSCQGIGVGRVCRGEGFLQLADLLGDLSPHIIQGFPFKTAGHSRIGNLTRPNERRLISRHVGNACNLVRFLHSRSLREKTD